MVFRIVTTLFAVYAAKKTVKTVREKIQEWKEQIEEAPEKEDEEVSRFITMVENSDGNWITP